MNEFGETEVTCDIFLESKLRIHHYQSTVGKAVKTSLDHPVLDNQSEPELENIYILQICSICHLPIKNMMTNASRAGKIDTRFAKIFPISPKRWPVRGMTMIAKYGITQSRKGTMNF